MPSPLGAHRVLRKGTSQHADYDATQGEVNHPAQKLFWFAQNCPHPSSPKYDILILAVIKTFSVVFGGGARMGGGGTHHNQNALSFRRGTSRLAQKLL